MSIYIVRHGETNENKNQTVQTEDVSLSENGHAQASLLALRLKTANISKILCSDLVRAQQTAFHVNQVLNLECEYTAALRERSFGDLRGRTYSDIGFNFFADDYQPVNGENWRQFNSRVAEAWQSIVQNAQHTSGSLLVVTHGLVCRAIVNNHLRLEDSDSVPARWSNTSVTEVESHTPFSAIRINCDKHITEEGLRSFSTAAV